MVRKDDQGRRHFEATRYAVAEIIVSADHLNHVRLETGNPDMTLREAAMWMTDQLFPLSWPGGELAEAFGKKVRTTFDDS